MNRVEDSFASLSLMSIEHRELQYNEQDTGSKIGEGSFGAVFRGRFRGGPVGYQEVVFDGTNC